ncbi:DUF1963 domain-containing protein [Streptomyces sp. NPDC048142]|uniref:DUF1963 domain-containing protein n=1 Tax=Streptomyces sp. NPDC048142 TaxID=3365501 RepID=UPI00371BAE33
MQNPVKVEIAEAVLDSEASWDDPRLSEEASRWVLLAQFDSDDAADMMWGDGGALYWLIRPENLAERRLEREARQRAYRSLRSHVEGLNGRARNVDTFLHSREKRQSRGRVAQTPLSAIQLMVENLRTIESFLRDQRLWKEENYTLGDIRIRTRTP